MRGLLGPQGPLVVRLDAPVPAVLPPQKKHSMRSSGRLQEWGRLCVLRFSLPLTPGPGEGRHQEGSEQWTRIPVARTNGSHLTEAGRAFLLRQLWTDCVTAPGIKALPRGSWCAPPGGELFSWRHAAVSSS